VAIEASMAEVGLSHEPWVYVDEVESHVRRADAGGVSTVQSSNR
jgi:hypothetical protein